MRSRAAEGAPAEDGCTGAVGGDHVLPHAPDAIDDHADDHAEDHTQPIPIAVRRAHRIRPYLARVAAAVTVVGLVASGVLVRSYEAHPGEPLWLVAQVVFPAKSRSVVAASAVSTALNRARVALEAGRIDVARAAYQDVQGQLASVDDADGRSELTEQVRYVATQLDHAPATDGGAAGVSPAGAPDDLLRPLATGQAGALIPSGPSTTPGATEALATTAVLPAVLAAPAGATAAGTPPPDPGASGPAVTSSGPFSAAAPAATSTNAVTPPAGSVSVSLPTADKPTSSGSTSAGSTSSGSTSSGSASSGSTSSGSTPSGSTSSGSGGPAASSDPAPVPTDPPTSDPATSQSAAPTTDVDSANTGGGDSTPGGSSSDGSNQVGQPVDSQDPATPASSAVTIDSGAGSAVPDGTSAVSSTDHS